MVDVINDLGLEITQDTIIKVMGVGGGGCNAVNYLYSQGITDVSFLVCNTDKQCLNGSRVPAKLQLGPGWGAGGTPEVAQQSAAEYGPMYAGLVLVMLPVLILYICVQKNLTKGMTVGGLKG